MARVNSNLVKVGLSTASIADHTIGVEKLKFGSIIQNRTMTSDQQVITGLDTIRPETAFTQVYKNGILLDSSDYTINSATQITLTIGADLNDEITVRSLIDNAAPPLARVADNTITANKIADGVITANKIHSVDSSKIPSNILYNGQSTIQDGQGNVRALNRTDVTTTPYALPSGSSGKYFSCSSASSVFTIDASNCTYGQIITIWNYNTTNMTISWTNMNHGVWIAGDTTSLGTSGSVTLAGKGLVTVLSDTDQRLIFNGNVS